MLKILTQYMLTNPFARNVSVLAGGTAFAQLLTVLSLPLLTRIYRPHDFEVLAVYVAVLNMATVVSCLRYNVAIPLPEQDVDGMALLVTSLLCATLVSVLLAMAVLGFPEVAAGLFGQAGLVDYLWMVPLGVFLASIYSALQYWSSRKKRFGLITRTRVARAVGGIAAQITTGLIIASPFGLILGRTLYGGLGALGLGRNLLLTDLTALRALDFSRVVSQALENKRFPLWSVPESLFNTAGVQLPVILIAAHSVGPEAGFVMLAMRVVALPMGLIGSSVAQVFLTEAPAKHRAGILPVFTLRTMLSLLKISAPPLISIGALSPLVFPLMFGPDWARAGWVVAWMTPWFVLQFVASPVSTVLHVTGK